MKTSRRDFLRATAMGAAATASGLASASGSAAARPHPAALPNHGPLIDTNVTLSRWPGRRLPLDETPALVSRLHRQGVTQAWAGSFDALLAKDMASVNSRLAAECRKLGRRLLLPFGSINPALPDWENDLRRCHEVHRMPGLRLYPNYHRYTLDDSRFARLLDLAQQRGLIVQIVVTMEDERMQHPLLQVPHVDVSPLPALLATRRGLTLVLLNWGRGVKSDQLAKLAKSGQTCFDIATVEGVGGVANLLQQVPADRIVFGSYAPFFYFESALLKLKESPLTESQLTAIRSANARRCLHLPASA
jgi:uncharacterized protein